MIATLVQYERTKPACIQASALSMVDRVHQDGVGLFSVLISPGAGLFGCLGLSRWFVGL